MYMLYTVYNIIIHSLCRECSTVYRLVCLKSMPPEECYQRKVSK